MALLTLRFCLILCCFLVFNGAIAITQQCGGPLNSNHGSLQIEPSNVTCVWVIQLKDTTGIRLQLKQLTKEPINLIPEQTMIDINPRSFWINDSKDTYSFQGKILAIVAPPRQQTASLSWAGINADNSGGSLSTNFSRNAEGNLDWEKLYDGNDKIFWAIEFAANGQLNWTLESVLPQCGFANPCESISFTVFHLVADGNVTDNIKTCEGSSMGSVAVRRNSQVLILLSVNSPVAARSLLKATWKSADLQSTKITPPSTTASSTTHASTTPSLTTTTSTTPSSTTPVQLPISHETVTSPSDNEVPTRKVEGILAGTYSGLYAISFMNPSNPIKLSSDSVQGLSFDWNSKKVYWAKGQTGIFRSNLDGGNKVEVVADRDVRGLAIEPISGNFYYGSWTKNAIIVCERNVDRCSSIVSTDKIYDIALNLPRGFLFWSIWGHKVLKGNLDGTNKAEIPNVYGTYGIGVDDGENHLYWSEGRQIKYRDLSGTSSESLPGIETNVADVVIDDGKVYYSYNGKDEASGTSQIHFQRNQESASNLFTTLPDKARYLSLYGTMAIGSNPRANPCDSANCAHLCILMSETSYRCLCQDGTQGCIRTG